MEHPLELSHQAGPVLVTLAYVALYYAFQIRVALTKARLAREYRKRNEKFDRYFGQDRQMLAVDRVQLNMLEHMPPFLVLLWLHAVFVGPTGATVAGTIYLLARGAYPLLIGGRLGRGVKASIFISTLPGYLVLVYFCSAL
ncbi:MAG: hypothetical protein ACI8RZ_007542, partial [Myxococcota bacterium]